MQMQENVTDYRTEPVVEITWGRAIKVWWSLTWRGFFLGGIASFIYVVFRVPPRLLRKYTLSPVAFDIGFPQTP